jgi:signal transduction histidine kinase
MRICKQYIQVVFSMIMAISARSQTNPVADSIVYHLDKVTTGKSRNDSSHIEAAIKWMLQNKKYLLLNNAAVNKSLDRLKPIMGNADYYQIILVFFESHQAFDTVPNEALIEYGKSFIEKNRADNSPEEANMLSIFIRALRLPYRNSSHIYEGIEYFMSLTNTFSAKKDSITLSIVYNVLTGFHDRIGLTEKAEYYALKSIDYLNDNDVANPSNVLIGKSGKVHRYSTLGAFLIEAGKFKEGEKYLDLAVQLYKTLKKPLLFQDGPFLYMQLAKCKTGLYPDSARYYYNQAERYYKLYKSPPEEYAYFYLEKANSMLLLSETDSVEYYCKKSIALKEAYHLSITSPTGQLIPNYYYAQVKLKQHNPGEAIRLLTAEIAELKKVNARVETINELILLSTAFAAAGKNKEAFATLQEVLLIKEKMKTEEANAKSISFDIEKKMQDNDIKIAVLHSQDESNQKAKYYLYGITILLSLFAVTLGFAIVNKQKSNARLVATNTETNRALEQLKQTQFQLVQSEKMASLGELTAGIAHEIQNPLNFVNNFSEVNSELIKEMKEEIDKGNYEDAKAIATDIDENEQKINHHGKRADAIVKGMLQHSRSSNGVKEPTDINVLADEYFRLAYHGLRAKDKSFNATMITDFDDSIGMVNVIPQDMGRVILNLITNAFYVVDEKKRQAAEGYEPTVTVSTKKNNGKVEISVKDNGNGIPQKVLDKIFQPFFTTKPTGQGTGLGLSLSYDIVKAHGGELTVQTREKIGTEFTIQLPLV